jgi:octaprenyl-diphosphate synthase
MEIQTRSQPVYSPIQRQLVAVEELLQRELQTRFEELQPIMRHGALMGGKRLRPALVLLSGAAAGPLADSHVTIGVVMELIHTATLVHDDVLDGAQQRRHLATVNAKWSNEVSILLGDYLFATSYSLAATVGSGEVCRAIGEAARRVCEGELRQVMSADNFLLDEETYLEIVHGKTAELTRISCLLGARLAGASERIVRSLSVFGEAVGIAFQIVDDYLDLWGEPATVGKTLGSDLRQGKMTLPVIRLLDRASPADREQIVSILQGPPRHRFDQLLPMLQESDAQDYTRTRAKFYAERAINALAELADSDATRALASLAQFTIERSH